MDENIIVAKFQKNASEEVRAQIVNYKGYELIDLRVFAQKRDGDSPTRKGLTLNVHLLPELKAAVLAIEKFLNQRPDRPEIDIG